MKKNVGAVDTAIRSILACILLIVAVEGIYSDTMSMILAAMGMALCISCSFGVCLIYRALGIDTLTNFTDLTDDS